MTYKFDGHILSDRYGRKIASVDRDIFYDGYGAKMGKIARGSIYDKRGARVASVMGNMLRDDHYTRLTTLSDIKKIIDKEDEETVLAALWYFFIRDKDRDRGEGYLKI